MWSDVVISHTASYTTDNESRGCDTQAAEHSQQTVFCQRSFSKQLQIFKISTFRTINISEAKYIRL